MNEREWQGILSRIEDRETTRKCLLSPLEIERSIQELESTFGFPLPAEYRSWLERFDDVSFDGAYFCGLSGDGRLSRHQSEWASQGWVNVANDGCGDYYALVLNQQFGLSAPVVFIDVYKELADAYIVASEFPKFVQGLLMLERDEVDREGAEPHWPFDRIETLKMDPEIMSARNIRFPWAEFEE